MNPDHAELITFLMFTAMVLGTILLALIVFIIYLKNMDPEEESVAPCSQHQWEATGPEGAKYFACKVCPSIFGKSQHLDSEDE